jgi:hypothetical protein
MSGAKCSLVRISFDRQFALFFCNGDPATYYGATREKADYGRGCARDTIMLAAIENGVARGHSP